MPFTDIGIHINILQLKQRSRNHRDVTLLYARLKQCAVRIERALESLHTTASFSGQAHQKLLDIPHRQPQSCILPQPAEEESQLLPKLYRPPTTPDCAVGTSVTRCRG